MQGKSEKFDTLNFVRHIKIILPISMLAGLLGFIGVDKVVALTQKAQDEKMFGEYSQYFLKTDSGRPLRMPIKDNMLNFFIKSPVNEMTKKIIEYGLTSIGNITGKKINVQYSDTKLASDYTSIEFVDEILDAESEVAGLTTLSYNKTFATINYPVKVQIESKYKDCYFADTTKFDVKDSVLLAILEHEIGGHSLGRCDLYSKDAFGKSLMFYRLDNNGAREFTELDKNIMRYVYNKDTAVKVELPNEIIFKTMLPQKEEEKEM